jgi:hypothetical protein
LKVKEKFEKINKEKLLEFCDLFDISVAKATTKKEDIVTKLVEFLEKPHATTDVLVNEKEKVSLVLERPSVQQLSLKIYCAYYNFLFFLLNRE